MGHIRARAGARLCAVTIALAVASGAAAQQAVTADPAGQPEVPFVSRLRAEASDGGIRLTWKDSPDVVGTCLIYRSPSEITAQTIATATLAGKVESGVESWVDTPPDGTPYFYAVVMQDAAGVVYPLLVPFRNVTTTAVAVAAAEPSPAAASEAASPPVPQAAAAVPPASAPEAAEITPAPAAATTAAPAPAAPSPVPLGADIPARITAIAAALSAAGDAVTVSFASSNPSRELLLFWSSTPFAGSSDLLRAASVAPLDPGTTRYVLPVLPASTYWFAVLDAGLYKVGQFPLVQGLNATTAAIKVPSKSEASPIAAAASTRRVLQLPSLTLDLRAATGDSEPGALELPPVTPVSAATSRAIDLLLQAAGQKPSVARVPTILDSDKAPQAAGEAAQLLEIVQGSFRLNDMGGAEQRLLGFLSVPRSAQAAAHARFYLGQSYWFQGRTRDALLEFLTASDFYAAESQPWIDAALQKLEAQDG